MAPFNFLKKKTSAKSQGKKLAERKIEKIQEVKAPKVKSGVRVDRSYRVLKVPHVTEKATDLTAQDQYIFRVFPEANKTELKKIIKNTYGVDVISVKIINVHRKKKRLGKIQGMKPGYKKAIVRIKKGQKIELLPR
ncbi:MAG: 50S ribosomal protein L23 [bacterium]|nr:50S ribosomal protein L23 [bacterium]